MKELNGKLDKLFETERKFADGDAVSEYCIEQFQHFFFSLQQLYFNGLHTGKLNKLFTPFQFTVNDFTKQCIRHIERLRTNVEPGYRREKEIEPFMISNFLFLKGIIREKEPVARKNLVLNKTYDPVLYKKYDSAYFDPLTVLYNEVNGNPHYYQHIENVWLTNSLVSLDYCKGYSDADCLVIVKESAFENKVALRATRNALTRLSKQLYLFDPLQHHGFIILNKTDISFYPQAWYPVLLFENAMGFIEKESRLNYGFRDDRIDKRLALYKNLKFLLHCTGMNIGEYKNLFTLKWYVSNITLLPVLYMQLKDDYIYKREAFAKIDQYFDDISLFKKAEEIRSAFPYRRIFKRFPSFLHPALITAIHGKLNRNRISEHAGELTLLTESFLSNFISTLYNEGV